MGEAVSAMPRHWRPLRRLGPGDFHPLRREIVEEAMSHYGISEVEARARIDAEHDRCRFYLNDLYQVAADDSEDGSGVTHLCIRRTDGSMFKDWRHFQQIKNEICGPEREGIELYPAESRKVDTSNKWHIWVLPEGMRVPLGWGERDIDYSENRDVPGMRQRSL